MRPCSAELWSRQRKRAKEVNMSALYVICAVAVGVIGVLLGLRSRNKRRQIDNE